MTDPNSWLEILILALTMVFFFGNVCFLTRANSPSRLIVPLVGLGSIVLMLASEYLLRAGAFFSIILVGWSLPFLLLWLLSILMKDSVEVSQSPRLYESLIAASPRGIRILIPLAGIAAYVYFFFLMPFTPNGLREPFSLAVGGISLVFACFSIIAIAGMTRNLADLGTIAIKNGFLITNLSVLMIVGTLAWRTTGFFNQYGLPILAPGATLVGELREGRQIFRSGDRFGFVDSHRRMVIPATYLRVEQFSEGLSAVKSSRSRKYGFIDRAGKEVVPPRYDFADNFSDGLAAVGLDGKYGFIDRTGRLVVETAFVGHGRFHNGLAAVAVPGIRRGPNAVATDASLAIGAMSYRGDSVLGPLWGVIDANGKWVVEPELFGFPQNFHYSPVHLSGDYSVTLPSSSLPPTRDFLVSRRVRSHRCSVEVEASIGPPMLASELETRMAVSLEGAWHPRGLDLPTRTAVNCRYDCSKSKFVDVPALTQSEFDQSILFLLNRGANSCAPSDMKEVVPVSLTFVHELFPGK